MYRTIYKVSYDHYRLLASTPYSPSLTPFAIDVVDGFSTLLSAPHATAHTHHDDPDRIKSADLYTDLIVKALTLSTGCGGIWTAGEWKGNANADPLERCYYKQRLLELVDKVPYNTVFDIHGMSDRYGVDICIGTGGDKESDLLSETVKILSKYNLSYSINVPFAAKRAGTVTQSVLKVGKNVLQLEISASTRNPTSAKSPLLFAALVDMIQFSTSL